MNETSRTLATAERLIRERFHKHFGDRYCIDSIVGSSFTEKTAKSTTSRSTSPLAVRHWTTGKPTSSTSSSKRRC